MKSWLRACPKSICSLHERHSPHPVRRVALSLLAVSAPHESRDVQILHVAKQNGHDVKDEDAHRVSVTEPRRMGLAGRLCPLNPQYDLGVSSAAATLGSLSLQYFHRSNARPPAHAPPANDPYALTPTSTNLHDSVNSLNAWHSAQKLGAIFHLFSTPPYFHFILRIDKLKQLRKVS